MSVVSVRLDEKLKSKMDKYKHVNWSEVLRKAIAERVALEEMLTKKRSVKMELVREAAGSQDRLRAKTSGKWSGAEEIRKWRDLRK